MAYTSGDRLHGFLVTRVRESEELSATFYELEHEKTGAQLVWLDNGEDNKLFCVTFKTIPEDSTGVFHILEHTVLNGSEKFPVREPFVELLKSSMNTFLNALTFPDRTVYPVSSRNRQDYLNLASVYLDAVFAPSLLHNPSIFRQEGWHMERDEESETPLSYKGVVLNEMKGAMSDPDDVVQEAMGAMLFPDNCYGFNSGGEPGVIQTLTYEKYVETYHRFYHPGNARFYLDGSVPFEETLEMIDGYLARYEKSSERYEIPMQKPVSGFKRIEYAVGEDDPTEGRTVYARGGLVCNWDERVRSFEFSALTQYLTGTNESPLTHAVLASGLAKEVAIAQSAISQQSWYYVYAQGTDEDKVDALRRVIREALEQVERDGIDREQFRAILSRGAYTLKELPEPAGLMRAFNSYIAWLYGGDPLEFLLVDDLIQAVSDGLENGEIDRMVREILLDGESCELVAVPSRTLAQKTLEDEQERLTQEWEALDEAGKQQIVEEQAELLAFQQREDTKEALATIPVLNLSEIERKPLLVPTVEEHVGPVTILHHPIPSHGIVHTAMYFSLADFSYDELVMLSALPMLIGNLPTDRYSVQDIQRELYALTGAFLAELNVFSANGSREQAIPVLHVRFSALKENLAKAQAFVMHLLFHTRFDADDRIREIVEQHVEEARMSLASSGLNLARYTALAHVNCTSLLEEAFFGHTHMRFLFGWKERFEEVTGRIRALVSRLQTTALTQSHLTLGITTDPGYSPDLAPILSALPAGMAGAHSVNFVTGLPERAGIPIPAQIGYAVIASSLSAPYSGAWRVAGKILSLEYLWNTIRVQGGAYGSGITMTRSGSMMCYSYRDPTPAASLEAYKKMPKFLTDFAASAENVDKYILSAVSDTEPLMRPSEWGLRQDGRHFSGVTDDDLIREREEMLSAKPSHMQELAEILDDAIRKACVSVAAHPDALRACPDLTLLADTPL